jgi:AraC-like DNA-binding protein
MRRAKKEFPIGIFSETAYIGELHHHVEHELFYLAEGQARFGIEGDEHELYAGDVIFLEPGIRHSAAREQKDRAFHYYALVFDLAAIGAEGDPCRAILDGIRVKRFLTLSQELTEKIKQAAALEKDKSFGRELRIKATLFDILAHILATGQYLETSPAQATDAGNRQFIGVEKALTYIRSHFRETITLDRVLREANYSKSHFIRLFKAATGMSLTDFVNQYRVEKSCLDLIYSGKNVTEIATENGFGTVQYFSKVFKRYMNCTPKQYQKSGKSMLVPSTATSIMD